MMIGGPESNAMAHSPEDTSKPNHDDSELPPSLDKLSLNDRDEKSPRDVQLLTDNCGEGRPLKCHDTEEMAMLKQKDDSISAGEISEDAEGAAARPSSDAEMATLVSHDSVQDGQDFLNELKASADLKLGFELDGKAYFQQIGLDLKENTEITAHTAEAVDRNSETLKSIQGAIYSMDSKLDSSKQSKKVKSLESKLRDTLRELRKEKAENRLLAHCLSEKTEQLATSKKKSDRELHRMTRLHNEVAAQLTVLQSENAELKNIIRNLQRK